MKLLQVPKVEKIVVNCGIGDAAQNSKGLDAAVNDLALITGQRPVKTRAKKAIATFKIRENQPLGIAVTLRGNVSDSYVLFDSIFIQIHMLLTLLCTIMWKFYMDGRCSILSFQW